jgi:tetratricopeptide (TPR) repeat protein
LAVRPDGDALQKVGSVRADVVALLREKRYEETLAALYRARSESPGDRELQRSIEQLKEFLVGTYAKRLGGLDQVAKPIALSSVRSPDAVLLARYIDGVSTYGDLAQMCPLGQLRTLQVLIGLYHGTEPPRIYAMDAARVTPDPPTSGLRAYDAQSEVPTARVVPRPVDDGDSRPPDTARSSSLALGARPVETEDDRRYKDAFSRGTACFIQGRYQDAAEFFDACLRLRPGDRGAEVMLKRCLGQGESR